MWHPYRVALGVVTMLALACGASTQAPGPDGAGSDQPKYGGVLNFRTTDDMSDWDMRVNGQTSHNADGIRLAYNSLVGFRATPYPNANFTDTTLVPELAGRWEISSDAKTFTFHLRKDVKWANRVPLNGRQLTSDDVKWSYEYISSTGQFRDLPTSQNSYMWEGLVGVEAPDPATVVVKFKDGFAPFSNYAATKLNPIYPKELLNLDGAFTTNILGTGPFQWDKADTQQGSRWVFKKNPGYLDPDSVYLDTIRWVVIKDEATAQAAFQTKQVDSYSTVDGTAISDVLKNNPVALNFDYPGGPRYVLMNFARPPMDNLKVRQAISRAIDRDAFIKVLGGRGEWALAGTNRWVDLFTQEEVKQIYRFDVAEGKRLMAEAGYANGADVKFMYDTSSGSDATLVPLLQSQLKAIGINLVLDGRTRTAVGADRKVGDFQVHWFGEYGSADPDYSLFGYYHPGQRLNYTGVNDPRLTQLVEAQRREPDPVKRRDLIKQAVKYLNEAALGIAIDRTGGTIFWHPYVRNFTPHLDYGTGRSKMVGVWLDK